MIKIFIVEDDENIRELVLYALKSAGFDVAGFERGEEFWCKMQKESPGLILLDIMLPGEDGIAILKKLRQDTKTDRLPVIMLTAKGSEYDRVKGLDLGADDYITKPFSVLELISRVRTVLRRSGDKQEDALLSFKSITLDTLRRTVSAGGEVVVLTYKEFELLRFLLANKGIVLTRDKIMNVIWEYDFEGESRTVDMHIKTLRQKLGAAGEEIKTIRGVGYKIGD